MNSQKRPKGSMTNPIGQSPLAQLKRQKNNYNFNSNRNYSKLLPNNTSTRDFTSAKPKNLNLWRLRNPGLRRLTPLPNKGFYHLTMDNQEDYAGSLQSEYGNGVQKHVRVGIKIRV